MNETNGNEVPLSKVAANITLKSFALVYTLGKGKKFCKLTSLLGSGNQKLPSTTAIYNMSSAHDCPSFKLGFCQAILKTGKKAGMHVCYAKHSETAMRPFVQPYREAQGKYWLEMTAEEFAWQFLMINSVKGKPYTALRFNEAGDFHSQECLNKAEKIARILGRFGIKVYCYTARQDLDFSKVRNLIISGSGFQKEGIPNVFKMIEKGMEKPKGYGICKGDCRVCNRCMVRGKKTVILRH